ncbi:MAG TPA: fibronectin type III domain-containing protein, partial [Acidimicrobiales bacterium]|nr:fibronectin type III domain-containing protein [Acidimicrobiales bacterium]
DLAGFVAQLSPYDDVTGTYSSGGASTFSLRNEAPLAPAAVTLAATSGSSVNVTIQASATPSVDQYQIRRGPPATLTGCGGATYTIIDTVKAAPTGDTTYVDGNVQPDSDYCYRVFSVDDGDVSSASVTAGPVTTPLQSADGAPVSLGVELRHDDDTKTDKIYNGDEILIAFNEAMAAPDDGDAIRISDANSAYQILCDTPNELSSSNCTRNSSAETVRGVSYGVNQVITVVSANRTLLSGTDDGLLADGTSKIYEHRGFTDVEGIAWSIPAGGLTVATYSPDGPISTEATITNGGFAGEIDQGDVITLTFDQDMRAPDPGDFFKVQGASGPLTTITCGSSGTTCARSTSDPKVITVTITDAGFSVELPATITNQGGATPTIGTPDKGFENLDRIAWDLVNSPAAGKRIAE